MKIWGVWSVSTNQKQQIKMYIAGGGGEPKIVRISAYPFFLENALTVISVWANGGSIV